MELENNTLELCEKALDLEKLPCGTNIYCNF